MERAKRKHERKIRKGVDYEKLAKIWHVLAAAADWLHIAEISRRTKINEVTVRWYLDHYLDRAIIQERIHPQVRFRMVKLKAGLTLESYAKALEGIRETKQKVTSK